MDAKEGSRQRRRLHMTAISASNWCAEAAVLALYAWTGGLEWWVSASLLAAGLGTTTIFALLILTGQNLKLADKELLIPQLFVACVIQLTFLVLVPKAWPIFLLSIFATYNFAVILFSQYQFRGALLLFGVGTAVAFYLGHERFEHPGTSGTDIALLWLTGFFAMRSNTAIGAHFSTLRAQLSDKNHRLAESLRTIEALASHDDLTGLYNRRHFVTLLQEEIDRAERTGQIFCVAILDLDHFKSVNDRYGHPVGDLVLQRFAAIVSGVMRSTDRFARYGGEEFVMLLTATTEAVAAEQALERVRTAVQQYDWQSDAPALAVTVSSGIAVYCPGESISRLLQRADDALYRSKEEGRNRVTIAHSQSERVATSE